MIAFPIPRKLRHRGFLPIAFAICRVRDCHIEAVTRTSTLLFEAIVDRDESKSSLDQREQLQFTRPSKSWKEGQRNIVEATLKSRLRNRHRLHGRDRLNLRKEGGKELRRKIGASQRVKL